MTAAEVHGPPQSVAHTRAWLVLGSRLQLGAVIAPLIVFLALWLWYFSTQGVFAGGPGGHVFGGDFAMFVGGAQVVRDGGNPFNPDLLYRTESSWLHHQGLVLYTNRSMVRVGYPPLFFWAIQPLSGLPFQPTAVVWILSMYALSAVGFLAVLRYLGWSRWILPCLVFLMMPQVIKGALYGNVSGLVFAAIGCSLLLLRRHPLEAGVLLSLGWLKPQVGLPIALLIILFHAPSRGRVLAGFGIAVGSLLALTVIATGWESITLWYRGLTGYYHDLATQTYLPSLTNLYDSWAPHPVYLGLTGLSLCIALALTAGWWWTYRGHPPTSVLAISGLWFLWFVAVPYVHLYDEIVLSIPVLACLGRNGHRLSRRLPTFGLYLLAFTWLPSAWTPLIIVLVAPTLLLLEPPARKVRYRLPAIMLIPLLMSWFLFSLLPFLYAVQSLRLLTVGACFVVASLGPRYSPLRRAGGELYDRPLHRVDEALAVPEAP